MKTIYTRPICPDCLALKAKLTREGVHFRAIAVVNDGEPRPPGEFISRFDFAHYYPDVRSFPFVVEGDHG